MSLDEVMVVHHEWVVAMDIIGLICRLEKSLQWVEGMQLNFYFLELDARAQACVSFKHQEFNAVFGIIRMQVNHKLDRV